jgi:membrane-associated protein
MIASFGWATYVVLFLIIFCETGLVVTPFLPGDSLLFAAGTFTVMQAGGVAPALDLKILIIVLSVAAFLGDSVNYSIGKFIGPKIFSKENVRFLNKNHLIKAHEFYEKHGGKTIILARFIPIIRTFAPFVAGIGKMTYLHFISYNIIGGIAWVSICVLGGHYLANVEFVKKHFELVLIAIVMISVLPAVIEVLRQKAAAAKQRNN